MRDAEELQCIKKLRFAKNIAKIGIEEVERLETEKPVKKWTAEELQDIIDTYKAKLYK